MENRSVRRAIEGEVIGRGDGFDVGEGHEETRMTGGGIPDSLMDVLTNPSKIMKSLNLTRKQSENIASIIAGGGAGVGYKMLSKYIGGELASAIGGFLGAHLAKRITTDEIERLG